MEFLSHLRALPEMWVLVATCVLMILDLYSKDEQRRVAFYGAQAIVGVAFSLTLYVVCESRERARSSSTACTSRTSSGTC